MESFINTITKIDFQRWYTNIKLIIEDFEMEIVALIDSRADMNCIQEGLISVKYHEQTGQKLFVETSDNQDPGTIIPNKQTPIESIINTISKIDFEKWYTNVKVIIEDFEVKMATLIDSRGDMNCIQEGSYSIL